MATAGGVGESDDGVRGREGAPRVGPRYPEASAGGGESGGGGKREGEARAERVGEACGFFLTR
jgi:hypothetical protein